MSNEKILGGKWIEDDYEDGVSFHIFELKDRAEATVRGLNGKVTTRIDAKLYYDTDGKKSYIEFKCDVNKSYKIVLRGINPEEIETHDAKIENSCNGVTLLPEKEKFRVYFN